MRVLFVTGEYPPDQGGVGDYTHLIAEHLLARGLDVHVLTHTGAVLAADEGQPRVWREVVDWGWRSWGTVNALRQRSAADVVHIQYQTGAYRLHPAINFLPGWLRWQQPQSLLAVTFHDTRLPYLFPKAGALRPWANRMLARGCDLAIVTNIEDEQVATAWVKGSQTHLARIAIGSNIPALSPAGFDRAAWRAQRRIEADEWLIAYFGFLNASKGGETLIQTLDQLAQSGAPARLLMIGAKHGSSDPTNQDYGARVERLITARNLAARVISTGFLAAPEVSQALLAADCALLPYVEGISFTRGSLMAAFANGVPVISTQPRLLAPELVDGENVLLIPPNDPTAAAQAVRAVCTQPALKARLSQGARQLSQMFSWQRIAEQHVALYSRR